MPGVIYIVHRGYTADIAATETNPGKWRAKYTLTKNGGVVHGSPFTIGDPYATKQEAVDKAEVAAKNHIDRLVGSSET